MSNILALSAKVRARNGANAAAKQFAPAMLAAMLPFVGKKVLTATGDFTKAFANAMPTTNPLDYWQSRGYNISRAFRTCENTARGCHYGEAVVYFAKIESGVLESLYDFDGANFRTDFNAEEITFARIAVADARAALQGAERGLAGFGEHDNG